MSVPRIRAYQSSDRERCLEIYRTNEERRHVPPGYFEEFETFLEDDQLARVIVESAGSVIGIGGIQYWQNWGQAFLSFGLIHPDFHRRGFGSILLLSRLVLLEIADRSITVFLQATENSRPFFKKIGFVDTPSGHDAHGTAFYNCHLALTRSLHEQCATALSRSGLELPDDLAVPITAKDPPLLEPPKTSINSP